MGYTISSYNGQLILASLIQFIPKNYDMNIFFPRIRAVQFGMRSATLVEDPSSQTVNNNAATANNNSNSSNSHNLRRLQQGRESFRHLHQKPSGTSSVKAENLNIDNCYLLKGQMRRLINESIFYTHSPLSAVVREWLCFNRLKKCLKYCNKNIYFC